MSRVSPCSLEGLAADPTLGDGSSLGKPPELNLGDFGHQGELDDAREIVLVKEHSTTVVDLCYESVDMEAVMPRKNKMNMMRKEGDRNGNGCKKESVTPTIPKPHKNPKLSQIAKRSSRWLGWGKLFSGLKELQCVNNQGITEINVGWEIEVASIHVVFPVTVALNLSSNKVVRIVDKSGLADKVATPKENGAAGGKKGLFGPAMECQLTKIKEVARKSPYPQRKS
ncbi:hypothetical protein V6N11_013051 [Hibiscus sabdariffa]|uniref:Uncharacterized protein n=2 Tax=Hibiscus sabdariffa TaxID=183260 RepID=A0ABR2NCK1_9ROSI